MAWAFQSVSSVGTGSSTPTSTTLPSTYNTGSLLLLVFITDKTQTYTVNQSYTSILNSVLIAASCYLSVFYKFATSSSETAPTISASTNFKSDYFIISYSGVNAYDTISTLATTSLPTGTTNCTTNTLTAASYNELILNLFVGVSSGGSTNTITYGTPTGTTSRLNQVGSGSQPFAILLADENQINQGTSTARTSAAVKAGASTGTSGQYQIAFKPTNSGFFFTMG